MYIHTYTNIYIYIYTCSGYTYIYMYMTLLLCFRGRLEIVIAIGLLLDVGSTGYGLNFFTRWRQPTPSNLEGAALANPAAAPPCAPGMQTQTAMTCHRPESIDFGQNHINRTFVHYKLRGWFAMRCWIRIAFKLQTALRFVRFGHLVLGLYTSSWAQVSSTSCNRQTNIYIYIHTYCIAPYHVS